MTNRFDSGRRSLLAGGSAAAALWLTGAGTAQATAFTAFRQAIAEGAAGDEALAAFYRDTNYEGLWTVPGDRAAERREALFQALSDAAAHGLPVATYGIEALEQKMRDVRSQRDLGEVEVAMSRLYLRYATDIQTGVLDPHKIDAGLVLTVPLRDRQQLLAGFTKASPRHYLRTLVPASAEYARLTREKLRLESLLQADAWAPEVRGGSLKPGESGAAVVALRNRLISMGYLRRTASAVYDGEMQKAVQSFQLDHGISPDGVAGEGTLKEINTPLSARIGSIMVAMERERWMNMPLGERHVWVNLPDFSAQIRDGGEVTFETRAVIGANSPDRRSPEFSDHMETIVANPSWSVPRSIAVKEYLPSLRKDPHAAGHLQIYDRRGRVVDRSSVDFSQYTAGNFPYDLRQPPSAGNALGLVKFLFPNRWNIYLHDTPAKSLFQREVRAFSHGCIRLAEPFNFAYAVLSGQTTDPKGVFQSALATHRESPIRINYDLPVHITYRTAFTSAKGRLAFRRDVYGRDGLILDALQNAGVA